MANTTVKDAGNNTVTFLTVDTGKGLTAAVNVVDAGGNTVFLATTNNQLVQITSLQAIANSVASTLKNSEVPIQGVIDMPTANTAYTSGRYVEVSTTTAGNVTFTYADSSTRTRNFAVGLTRLPDAVTQWVLPSGSTFVGTFCNLK
jgi:hypothetical protein